MPGGSISRVLSRIQDHNKSLERAHSSYADNERAQSQPSSNKRKKSSSSSSSNCKSVEKGGVAVGGALQEQMEDLQSDLVRCRILVQIHQQQWYNQREREYSRMGQIFISCSKSFRC